jgi:hypothetical protein
MKWSVCTYYYQNTLVFTFLSFKSISKRGKMAAAFVLYLLRCLEKQRKGRESEQQRKEKEGEQTGKAAAISPRLQGQACD